MAQNLRYKTPDSWCFHDKETCAGRLYPWPAALTACPAGWHLPSDEEWKKLEMAVGMTAAEAGSRAARGDEGARLRRGGDSGFEALMTGYRRPDGSFVRRGERAAFWASTEANEEDAWHRDIRTAADTIYRSEVTKTYALSVRCVRD